MLRAAAACRPGIANLMALRVLGSDEHQKVLSLEDAIARLTAEAEAPDMG